MIIDEITRDDVATVLQHVQATCALKSYCNDCQFYIPGDGCALEHLPERWQIDDLIKKIRNGGYEECKSDLYNIVKCLIRSGIKGSEIAKIILTADLEVAEEMDGDADDQD